MIRILNNENPDLCKPCGGRCCQTMPGIALPEQFGAPDLPKMRVALCSALASGKWAIDWWDGDPRPDIEELEFAYFLRPATKGVTELFDPSWGGECVNLTSTGCSLSFEERPAGCQSLVPAFGRGNCHSPIHKDVAALAWLPYSQMIEEIAEEVVGVAT